jgi:hypothetical protein
MAAVRLLAASGAVAVAVACAVPGSQRSRPGHRRVGRDSGESRQSRARRSRVTAASPSSRPLVLFETGAPSRSPVASALKMARAGRAMSVPPPPPPVGRQGPAPGIRWPLSWPSSRGSGHEALPAAVRTIAGTHVRTIARPARPEGMIHVRKRAELSRPGREDEYPLPGNGATPGIRQVSRNAPRECPLGRARLAGRGRMRQARRAQDAGRDESSRGPHPRVAGAAGMRPADPGRVSPGRRKWRGGSSAVAVPSAGGAERASRRRRAGGLLNICDSRPSGTHPVLG